MRLIIRVVVFALSALSLPALAAQTSGLYQVRTALASSRKSERQPWAVRWMC